MPGKLRVDEIGSESGLIATTGGVSVDMGSSQYPLKIPSGATVNRPTTEATGLKEGCIRYNNSTGKIEFYNGSGWNGLDGTKEYISSNLLFYIDAARTDYIPLLNILGNWTSFAGRTNFTILQYDSVRLKNDSTDWVGYYPAEIFTSGKTWTISFDYYSDQNGSTFVLDNDGIVDNQYNASFTANTTKQSYSASITINTTGVINHFFRRSGGGNITIEKVKFYITGTTLLDISNQSGQSTLMNGLQISNGQFIFDGTDDYIDIPTFTSQTQSDVSMEIVIKQNTDNNKALEFFGTDTVGNAFPDAGFAYFPASWGVLFYRYINGSGDRPHVKAISGGNTINLANGNWHHLVGTYKYSTNTCKLYRNGQLISQSSTQENAASFQGKLGGNATSYALNGRVGLARIYNSVLSDEDVLYNYYSVKSRFSI